MNVAPFVCPVCNHRCSTPAFQCKDHFITGENFPILKCDGCGLHFTGHLPAISELGKYYKSDDYISHSDTRKGLINQVYHFVREYMLARKLKILKKHTGKEKGRLLDIGAGTGYFLHYASQKGWSVSGTEKDPDARKVAAEKWGIDIKPDTELFRQSGEIYDAITLWHVMEHLPDLDTHWKGISSKLTPEGVLIIALPNPESTDAKQYGAFWAAWDVPRHLWHFSPAQVMQLAGKHGFRIEAMHRMPFDSFYISMMSEKYRNSTFPLLKGLIAGKISWLVSLFDTAKCSSVIYVLRKVSK